MALELMDEHEKGEQVRAWLRQNGSAIVGGIAIGLGLIFGWQWWTRSQDEHRFNAATQYQKLTDAAGRNEAELVSGLTDELSRRFADTPYAALGAMQLADVHVGAGDFAAADAALAKAADLAAESALDSVIALRRARLAVARAEPEVALEHLKAISGEAWDGLAAEVRGDALNALDRRDEAREAYADALTGLETGAPNRRVVEMKLADLGGRADPPEA
jgi:predicted negative regulator of RcsB-dependent stress response